MNKFGQRGESLTESLVSILILTLSSILLLTVIAAGAKINRSAREADRAMYRQMLLTELAPEHLGLPGTVTVTVNGHSRSVPVSVYGEVGILAWYGEASP